jgi:acyl carrier protein
LTSKQDIFAQVKSAMVELFELEPDAIQLNAQLIEDLDLDSIDAIDMAARLQQLTGRRVPEEALKSLRTISDVVDLVHEQLTACAAEPLPVKRPA